MKFQTTFVSALLLLTVGAFAYLPLINQIGYTHDDWYLMASARAEGPGVFWQIFSVDRPGRALVMIPAYKLFGANPLFYNLSAYLFRVLGALAFFWLLQQLWPHQTTFTLSMSLLFLIYPGFLSQPNGIDYQSHILGLAAALLSVCCTVTAILTVKPSAKIALHGMSILLGWLYLSQMEWYIGFEFLRWACVFLLSARQGGTLLQKSWRALRWGYYSTLAPGVFLIWRIFFFHGERGATDVDLQLGQFRLYPLQITYHWMLHVAQDFVDVTLSAWVIPISQLAGYIQKWSGALAICTVAIILFALHKIGTIDSRSEKVEFNFQREAFWLGLFTIIGGLIPIALVNRDVAFPAYSRYSLVSSTGVAILIISILIRINQKILQNGILAGLCFIAILTHHANSVQYAEENRATKAFWWQVAWRVPQFEKNTTIIATYPGASLLEDYFIWGPADLVYYPEKQNPRAIQPGLFAAVLNQDTITKVVTRERQEYSKRKNIITYANYRNIIVLTQPSSNACLHIVDGNHPEYSDVDSDSIRAIGSYSEMEHVLAGEAPHTPPEVVFGPEPSPNWCYYYEKADLARQQGQWNDVITLGEQAFAKGLAPKDAIEWMPYLQAYARTGNTDQLTKLLPIIAKDPPVAVQACQIMSSMDKLSSQVSTIILSRYCSIK